MKKVNAEPYRDIDFSKAKRGAVIPVEPGKTKISIRLDTAVIEYFRRQVEESGGGATRRSSTKRWSRSSARRRSSMQCVRLYGRS